MLTQEALNDTDDAAGAVKLFDKEFDGAEQALPLKIKVKDLKAKDSEYWVEGATCSNGLHSVVLDAGLDRPDGIDPVAKEAKRFGDWARFTVVKVDKDKLKLDYTAVAGQPVEWDEPNKRWFINMKADPQGRKIKLKGALTEKIAGITVHFMLAPDKDNQKKKNWGVDLPATWKWKDVDAAVKHTDKADRKKLLHLSAVTDDKGELEISTLQLSRFGGDIFHLGAYIDQDPHLSKYVDGHTDLEKRKPVLVNQAVTVWRKFWYHEVKVTGLTVKGFGNAADCYKDVMVVMEAAPVTEMPRATANAISPPVIYPKHMVSFYLDAAGANYINNYPGDTADALVVGDANETNFMGLATASAERPVKIPMLNAHGLWIADGVSGAASVAWQAVATNPFPWPVPMDKELLDPPLQGGTLYASGTWKAIDVVPANPTVPGSVEQRINPQNGSLAAGDIDLDPNRSDPFTLRLKKPAALVVGPHTQVKISNLTVNGGTNFLGTSYNDGIVNCYTPNDEVDFINTINHELGHSFKQTAKTKPGASIPAHPLQYNKSGSHCKYQDKSCLMYESGPQPIHLDRLLPHLSSVCTGAGLVQGVMQCRPDAPQRSACLTGVAFLAASCIVAAALNHEAQAMTPLQSQAIQLLVLPPHRYANFDDKLKQQLQEQLSDLTEVAPGAGPAGRAAAAAGARRPAGGRRRREDTRTCRARAGGQRALRNPRVAGELQEQPPSVPEAARWQQHAHRHPATAQPAPLAT